MFLLRDVYSSTPERETRTTRLLLQEGRYCGKPWWWVGVAVRQCCSARRASRRVCVFRGSVVKYNMGGGVLSYYCGPPTHVSRVLSRTSHTQQLSHTRQASVCARGEAMMLPSRTTALAAAATSVVATCMLFPAARGFSVPILGHPRRPPPGGAATTAVSSASSSSLLSSSSSCNPSLQTRRVYSYPPSFGGRTRSPPPLTMAATTPAVKRVAIVGAGVGGLTLANALSTGGPMAVDEVKVFEKFDSDKRGIGGGVQINSGAVILARLGLGDAVKVQQYV